MDAKPSDLFLNVVEFFGILVPGAIIWFIHGNLLLSKSGIAIGNPDTSSGWVVPIVFSYLLGSILFGISVLLNKLPKFSKETLAYYNSACKEIKIPLDKNPENVFYHVFSYIRLNSPEALGELERQTAEYKFFRSLVVLFTLDLLITVIIIKITIVRIFFDVIMIGFSFYRFDFLFDWSYRLAFDYYLQLTNNDKMNKSNKDSAKPNLESEN